MSTHLKPITVLQGDVSQQSNGHEIFTSRFSSLKSAATRWEQSKTWSTRAFVSLKRFLFKPTKSSGNILLLLYHDAKSLNIFECTLFLTGRHQYTRDYWFAWSVRQEPWQVKSKQLANSCFTKPLTSRSCNSLCMWTVSQEVQVKAACWDAHGCTHGRDAVLMWTVSQEVPSEATFGDALGCTWWRFAFL